MTREQLLFYMNLFIGNADDVKILSGSFPADGDMDSSTGLWLAYYDPDLWAEIMAKVDSGGDPNDVYKPPFG